MYGFSFGYHQFSTTSKNEVTFSKFQELEMDVLITLH